MNEIEFLIRKFIGAYVPNMTTIYLPIESFHDGAMGTVSYISDYVSYDVPSVGLASLNIEYIISAVIIIWLLTFPMRMFGYLIKNILNHRTKII